MRYPSIDVLRTLAIFLMVFVHFAENLSGYQIPFIGLGAPLFALLMGASYRLWLNGQLAKGKSEESISKVSVRRGLFIFGCGFAFNILIWLPEDTFNWDVLTCIGAALLVLNFTRRLPLPISVVIAVLAIWISPLLRNEADYQAYWTEGYYAGDLTLTDLFIGFTTTGYFPFFPWIAYSLSGFVAASRLFREPAPAVESAAHDSEAEEPPPSCWPTTLLGMALLSTAALLLIARPYLPPAIGQKFLGGWHMFPPTIEYVVATIGMCLFLLGVTHQWIDRNPAALRFRGLLNVAKTFSRYSLTLYVLHHVIHLWPMWIYGVAMGTEPTYFWQQVQPTTTALLLACAFLLICYGVLQRLGPDQKVGLESWMHWLCDD